MCIYAFVCFAHLKENGNYLKETLLDSLYLWKTLWEEERTRKNHIWWIVHTCSESAHITRGEKRVDDVLHIKIREKREKRCKLADSEKKKKTETISRI